MLNTDGSYLRLHLLNSSPPMISIGEANMQNWTKIGQNPPQGRFPLYFVLSRSISKFSLHILSLPHLPTTFRHLTSRRRLTRSDLRKSSTHKKKPKIRNVQNVEIFTFPTSPTTVPPSSLITIIPPTHGFPTFRFKKRMGSTLGRLRHSALVIAHIPEYKHLRIKLTLIEA